MKTPTYYLQVKAAVLPRLQWYHADLLSTDRAYLYKYTGAFLHASRNSGTDLVLLTADEVPYSCCSEAHIETAETFAFRPGNDFFLYGSGGQVRQVTRKQAAKLFAGHVERIRAEWKCEAMRAAA